MVISDLNLENLGAMGWPGQIGANISPTPADCPPWAQQATDGPLDVYLTASKPYGSGLVSCHRPMSVGPGGVPFAYFQLSMELYLPPAAKQFSKSWEMDCKIVWPGCPPPSTTPIQNTANNSLQWLSSGMFQISGSNPWTDTGFNPGPPQGETWAPVVFRYKMDWGGLTFGPISLEAMGQKYTDFPAVFKNMPFQKSNWTLVPGGGPYAGLVSTQIQPTNFAQPSAFVTRYRNINNVWSDNINFV